MIERTTKISVEPTMVELAKEFCDLVDEQQAEFFNAISDYTAKWEHPFCFQLQYLTDCGKLTQGGRDIMEQIGQYSQEDNSRMDFDTAWDDAQAGMELV